MEDFESISVMKFVNLRSEGTISGKKGYIAVGSNCCYGEEVSTRGKVRYSYTMLLRVKLS